MAGHQVRIDDNLKHCDSTSQYERTQQEDEEANRDYFTKEVDHAVWSCYCINRGKEEKQQSTNHHQQSTQECPLVAVAICPACAQPTANRIGEEPREGNHRSQCVLERSHTCQKG